MKFDKDNIKHLVGVFFLVCSLALILTLKIGGASSWDGKVSIEENGFCKMKYGEDFRLDKNGDCKSADETISFSDSEFREICPEHKFFSRDFYSECWLNGK